MKQIAFYFNFYNLRIHKSPPVQCDNYQYRWRSHYLYFQYNMESALDLNIYSFMPVAPTAGVTNKYKQNNSKRQL